MTKLDLDRDFTRFQTDATFPHKVTAKIGDKVIVCSGPILAQQSKLLERKCSEGNGDLVLEEMLVIERREEIVQCLSYLHGADLNFNIVNIDTTMKFSSWYEVEDLFKNSLAWVKERLITKKKVEDLLLFLKIADSLNSFHRYELTLVLKAFMKTNSDHVARGLKYCLNRKNPVAISGSNIVIILSQCNLNAVASNVLKAWVGKSKENTDFFLKNSGLFDLKSICPTELEYDCLIAAIFGDTKSTTIDTARLLVKIRPDYTDTPQEAADSFVSTGRNTPKSFRNVDHKYNSSPKVTQKIALLKLPKDLKNAPKYNHSMTPVTTEAESSEYDGSVEVLVENLPPTATSGQIVRIFKWAGWIENVVFNYGNVSAVIFYRSPKSSEKLLRAVEGSKVPRYTLDGYQIHVSSVMQSYRRLNTEYHDAQYSDSDTTVVVGNLPPNASRKEILEMFKSYGWMNDVAIDRNEGCAFLEFKNAKSAVNLLSKREVFLYKGHQMYVEPYHREFQQEY